MQSSTSSVKRTSANAVDLVLSMNFDSPIDQVPMLLRCRYPLLSFLVHFFNAAAEILKHHRGTIPSRASGH